MKKALYLTILLAFSLVYVNAQSWIGSNKISCTQSFIEISSTINSNGEILSYGYFEGTLSSSGGQSITSYGGRDYYLIKFLSNGTVDWMKNFGSTLSDYVFGGVSVSSGGDILLTGGFLGNFKYSPTDSIESSGSFDIFLLGLNDSGDVIWARNAGQGASFQLPTTLGSDESGNVILAGLFIDSINIYNELSLYSNKSYADYFYGAFDPTNGNVKWLKQISSLNNSNSKINDIYGDTNSYLFTGVFADSVGFEDDTIVAYNNKNDVHLFASDSTGTISWIRTIRGAGDEFSYAILKDDEDNVYVSGYYNSDTLLVDANASSVNEIIGNHGSFDLFIAKYSSSGDLTWFKTMGGKYEDKTFNMEFFDEKIWISGYFEDTLNWGGISLISEGLGDVDMFTGALDKDGNFREANQYNGRNNSNDQGRGLFKGENNLYTLMRTNSDLLVLGDSIYTSDGTSFYMVLGVIGCQSISIDNIIKQDVNTCYGDSTGALQILATGGFGAPWKYSIDNGLSYQDIAYFGDLPAGDYAVVVIDAENCTQPGPVVSVGQPDTLKVQVITTQDITLEADGLIEVSATGGTSPYVFTLQPGGTPQVLGIFNFASGDSGLYVVEVNDLNNCGPAATDTIEIKDLTHVGFQDFSSMQLKVYPNPASGLITLEMPFDGVACSVELLSLTGQVVLSRQVYSSGSVIRETIDVSDLAKGMYMLRIDGQTLKSGIVVN